MKIRTAIPADTAQISAFLQALVALGKRRLPADPDFVSTQYVSHPDNILCSVAEDADGTLLGLQILKRASLGNSYGVTPGWGIIGTHVNPIAPRRGIGRALFTATRAAAQAAGLHKIDATIGATSEEALSYYEAMGFETYKTADGAVCKCYDVALNSASENT